MQSNSDLQVQLCHLRITSSSTAASAASVLSDTQGGVAVQLEVWITQQHIAVGATYVGLQGLAQVSLSTLTCL